MGEILLIDSLFEGGKIPPLDMITCNVCGEDSKVSDCEWIMDSEGWGYPEYKVHFCPYCNSDDVEDGISEEYEKKYWKELYGEDHAN